MSIKLEHEPLPPHLQTALDEESEPTTLRTEDVRINMGPQHPSTHGVLRLMLTLDGEIVKDVVPHIGYLHRASEKLAERHTYPQYITQTDRWDYLNAMGNNQIWCQCVEKMMGLEIPARADYLRVIVLELNRIASHLLWWGAFGLDVGAMTVFLYCFREREKILDLFEMLCGARLTYSYMRIGGVGYDLPPGWVERCRSVLDDVLRTTGENDILLTGNEIFLLRTQGVGILEPEVAVDYGCTGPILRGSGIPLDIRQANPYSVYDRFEFDIPTSDKCDCLGRYLVRVEEIRQSVRIVRQALDQLPEGEIVGKTPKTIRPPKGEAFTWIESPRGALGGFLVSDGTANPYRFKIRPPSFIHLQALPHMVRGWKVADTVAILGSIDIVLGEVDR
ncbi:MAG: NADH-quinone oxidoreductase subunit D [Armatimonadetes bacterium]|nr:NADH-quinone oxidoreductase subunit D [Armatimonadota bacterium]